MYDWSNPYLVMQESLKPTFYLKTPPTRNQMTLALSYERKTLAIRREGGHSPRRRIGYTDKTSDILPLWTKLF